MMIEPRPWMMLPPQKRARDAYSASGIRFSGGNQHVVLPCDPNAPDAVAKAFQKNPAAWPDLVQRIAPVTTSVQTMRLLVKQLEQQGVSIHAPVLRNGQETLLHMAVSRARMDLVAELLSLGANPNVQDAKRRTAYQRAAKIAPISVRSQMNWLLRSASRLQAEAQQAHHAQSAKWSFLTAPFHWMALSLTALVGVQQLWRLTQTALPEHLQAAGNSVMRAMGVMPGEISGGVSRKITGRVVHLMAASLLVSTLMALAARWLKKPSGQLQASGLLLSEKPEQKAGQRKSSVTRQPAKALTGGQASNPTELSRLGRMAMSDAPSPSAVRLTPGQAVDLSVKAGSPGMGSMVSMTADTSLMPMPFVLPTQSPEAHERSSVPAQVSGEIRPQDTALPVSSQTALATSPVLVEQGTQTLNQPSAPKTVAHSGYASLQKRWEMAVKREKRLEQALAQADRQHERLNAQNIAALELHDQQTIQWQQEVQALQKEVTTQQMQLQNLQDEHQSAQNALLRQQRHQEMLRAQFATKEAYLKQRQTQVHRRLTNVYIQYEEKVEQLKARQSNEQEAIRALREEMQTVRVQRNEAQARVADLCRHVEQQRANVQAMQQRFERQNRLHGDWVAEQMQQLAVLRHESNKDKSRMNLVQEMLATADASEQFAPGVEDALGFLRWMQATDEKNQAKPNVGLTKSQSTEF